MEDDYDEYRRWDGDVDVEVCFVKLCEISPTLCLHSSNKLNSSFK